MMVLSFSKEFERTGERTVRRTVFEPRSNLPVSAACVVASGVRETLGTLTGNRVHLRLLEPRLPGPGAWAAIAKDATAFVVAGPSANAAFVLRPPEALALTCALFGESPGAERPLSAIEARVLIRAMRSLAGALAPVCGARGGSFTAGPARLAGYTTYFELLVEAPAAFRIGLALSRDPAPACGTCLRAADLLDLQLEVRVELAQAQRTAGALAGLRPGAEVPMTTKMGQMGVLKVAGTVLARGECGAIGGRYAMKIGSEGDGA